MYRNNNNNINQYNDPNLGQYNNDQGQRMTQKPYQRQGQVPPQQQYQQPPYQQQYQQPPYRQQPYQQPDWQASSRQNNTRHNISHGTSRQQPVRNQGYSQYGRNGKRQTRLGMAFSDFTYAYGKIVAVVFIVLFGVQMITGINLIGFLANLLFGKFGLVLCLLFILEKIFNFLGTSLKSELKSTLEICKERKNSKFNEDGGLDFDDLEEEEEVEKVLVTKAQEDLHAKYGLNEKASKTKSKPITQSYEEDDFDAPVVKRRRPGKIVTEETEVEDEDWVPKKERRTVKEVDEVNSMDENMRRREAINRAMRAQRSEPTQPRRNP